MDLSTPRRRVDQGISGLISTVPAEMQMRDLLRPLQSSGQRFLRVLGRRTRAYDSIVKAWEDLHVVNPSDGATWG